MNFLLIGAVALALLATAGIVTGAIQVHRRRTSWGWFVASGIVLAMAVATGLAAAAAALFSSATGGSGPQEVPCEQVAAFVDAPGLPSGLAEAHCTHTGFQDSYYVMTGSVAPAQASAWLAQLPGTPSLTTEGCDAGQTTCIEQVHFDPRAAGGADYADFQAHVRSDGRLEFTFTAMDT